METKIDELKCAWKTLSDKSCNSNLSLDEIKLIVRNKSKNELLKIKQKMLIELYVSVLLFLLLLIFVVLLKKSSIMYASIFFIVIIVMSSIPFFRLKKIKITPNDNMKNYLTSFLQKFKGIYIKIYSILVPFAIIGGFFLSYDYAGLSFQSISFIQWLAFALVFILICLLGFIVQKKYFNWIYGKNIKRIELCLHDLEQDDLKSQ